MRKGYKKIEVYFPDAEYEAFLKKVKRTNLSISEFVRRMAAEQVIREAPHANAVKALCKTEKLFFFSRILKNTGIFLQKERRCSQKVAIF